MNRLVSVVVGVMGMAFVASAAPVSFSDDAFSGASGQSSFTSDEYGITLSAAPEGALLSQGNAGIGVDYSRFNDWLGGLIEIPDDLPYEIDYPEVLTISFDKEVNLESVFISNLCTDRFIIKWREKGLYELSTGEIGEFITENQNGELTLSINKTVSSISFSAKEGSFLGLLHDFSVRGVSYSSVPEPAMLSLLSVSLLGLGFVRSRKK